MAVYGQSGYNYKGTPTIMPKGQWLKEAGFDIGDYIRRVGKNVPTDFIAEPIQLKG